ncbi:conjugal transfer protein TraN [Vibrio cholerae]|nr:conjugal transfer protein TraN [Vibrio cholerae]
MENNKMKRAGAILIAAVCSCSSLVFAGNTSQANSDGKSFADSINNSKIKDLGKSVDPNTIPNYQGADVPEKQYYNSGLNIENEAQNHAASDPNAQYINSSRISRPQITINSQTDPLFKRHEDITLKANSLTNTYSGCVDLPVGTKDVTKYEDKTCNVSGRQDTINYTCKRNLEVSCSNPDAGLPDPFVDSDFVRSGDAGMYWGSNGHIFWYGNPSTNNRHHGCKWYENTIKFYVSDVNTIPEFVLEQVAYDDWLFIRVNGHLGFQAVGGTQYTGFDLGGKFPGNYSCEQHGVRTFNINLNAKPKLKVGWNTISIRNLVGGGGNAFLKFRIHRVKGCTQKSSYSFSCPSGETHTNGSLVSSACTVGGGTRYIKGFPIYKSCWQWDMNYTRKSDPYFVKDAMCGQLESEGCGQTSTKCTNHNGLFCENQVVTYSCPYQTAARHVSLCGSQLVCPDGQCTSEFGQEYDPSTDAFKKAATALAVADEISKQLDVDNLTVFKGVAKACDKKAAGFSNCCKDSGWGADIGLASCSSEEKELGLMKEAKRVHFIGDYCAEKVLGACIRKKYVYCTYPSKLSRILMEQGNAQLGRGYGGPKDPDCRGFTIKELENLNFDGMDLSEFYSDVMSNAVNGSTPNATGAAQSIQEKLNARYPQLSEGGK